MSNSSKYPKKYINNMVTSKTKLKTNKNSTTSSSKSKPVSIPIRTGKTKLRNRKNDKDDYSDHSLSSTPDEILFSPKRQSLSENHNTLLKNKHLSHSHYLNSEKEEEEDNYDFDYDELLTYEYDPNEFDPFEFMASCGKRIETRNNALPKKSKKFKDKNTLVLDLDETLVHCSTEPIGKSDHVFPVKYQGVTYQVHLKMRPHMIQFLKTVSQMFEVVIFTASEGVYADKLLNILDPNRELIHHRIFRDSCAIVQGYYLKDLQILGRDLKKTIIVDNSPEAYSFNINNGIPIISWFDDEKDDELPKMIPFLKKLSTSKNVQKDIRNKFKLFKILDRYKNKKNNNMNYG